MAKATALSPHEALIFSMVLVSAADGNMTDGELRTIGRIVTQAPVFNGFDAAALPRIADRCIGVLNDEEGLDKAYAMIREGLPSGLRETAYAFAVDVAAAAGATSQEVLRVLELMRHRLDVERLSAAGIERGARARHARIK